MTDPPLFRIVVTMPSRSLVYRVAQLYGRIRGRRLLRKWMRRMNPWMDKRRHTA